MKTADDIIDHFIGKSRVKTNEETLTHDIVRLFKISINPTRGIFKRWLSKNVAPKNKSCLNFRIFQPFDEASPL